MGDSSLIIGFMKKRRLPRERHLRRIYLQCRRAANDCQAASWYLHYRCHNKAADAPANIAMDTLTSRALEWPGPDQLAARSSGVTAWAQPDVAHWIEQHPSMDDWQQSDLN